MDGLGAAPREEMRSVETVRHARKSGFYGSEGTRGPTVWERIGLSFRGLGQPNPTL